MTDTSPTPAIEIANLTKVYKGGKQALDNINLTIRAGRFTACWGRMARASRPPSTSSPGW